MLSATSFSGRRKLGPAREGVAPWHSVGMGWIQAQVLGEVSGEWPLLVGGPFSLGQEPCETGESALGSLPRPKWALRALNSEQPSARNSKAKVIVNECLLLIKP